MNLARRYGDKAMEMAEVEEDEERKAELLEISRICYKVPANPPETFHEAIQFVWFVQLSGIISENPLALNIGRFDQFMYPYYKADKENNRVTILKYKSL